MFEAGVPVLGICCGMQTMAQQLAGGGVESGTKREFGYAEVRAHGHTKLLEGIEDFRTEEGHGMLKVWMSHGDKVAELPPGFKVMCSTPSCPIAGMCNEEKGFYAVQFHPEVTHTLKGREMLNRFVLDICKCSADWVMGDYVAEAVAQIREQVGDEEVILGLSGGVDSSVAAALIHRAIGKQLTCVFVDHGLLRKDEREQVREDVRKEHGRSSSIVVDAVDRFMNELAGVTDPEQKRKIIGRVFVEIFQEEASQAARPPSGSPRARSTPTSSSPPAPRRRRPRPSSPTTTWAVFPSTLHLKLLEPLRSLFKDEVRELGVELGLSGRNGLSSARSRVQASACASSAKSSVNTPTFVREADAILHRGAPPTSTSTTRLARPSWSSSPVKSVGVMGDEPHLRMGREPALRRTPSDFMTAVVEPPAVRTSRQGLQPHHQ